MLIATDIDGTLLPDGAGQVRTRTAGVLADADRAGVPVVFVTGRPLRWMTGLWPHVGGHGRAIVSNGAVVYDVAEREVVRLAGLDAAVGLELADVIRTRLPDAAFALECVDGIRIEDGFPGDHPLPDGTPRGELSTLWSEPALKLLVRYRDAVAPEEIHRTVAALVGDAAVCTWSAAGLLEISAAGVTKASALAWLAERLGVAQDDVVAFGDMPNDVAMLRWAGRAYAVTGAHPDAVAAADQLAPPCDDEGVAEVIARLLRAG